MPDSSAENARKTPHTLAEPRPRAVTWRSILLGLIGVLFICGLAPYNDYAVANTYLIGNFLPIGVLLFVLVVVLLLNSTLRHVAPRHALREAELAITLTMMFVACSIPTSGLMRFLPTTLVGTYALAGESPDNAELLDTIGFPHWLLPLTGGTNAVEIGASSVIQYYKSRSPDGSVPWRAWIRPIFTWGSFVACLWGTMLFLSIIVRRQWVDNEKLAFPLATVYGSLIESPREGAAFNDLFHSRGFWVAAGMVFFVHAINALHAYTPTFPSIPLGYNFDALFADAPWVYLGYGFKEASIIFCVVGITFFLHSSLSFSVWFLFILLQVVFMVLGQNQITMTFPMRNDQTFGGMIVLCGVMLWIGRQHFWMVIRHAFGRARPDEVESRYLPYSAAAWGAVLCFAGLITWLMLAGATMIASVVIALALLMRLMITARILAETGIIFIIIPWPSNRVWHYPSLLAPEPLQTSHRSFFLSAFFSAIFHGVRESFAGFFQQSVRVADLTAYSRSHRWRTSAPLLVTVVLALVVAYFTSWGSTLWVEYTYATPIPAGSTELINSGAIDHLPRAVMIAEPTAYDNLPDQQSAFAVGLNIAIGAVLVGFMSFMRLTFVWWPVHPIAFIVLYSYSTNTIWLSVFLGWLVKVILTKLGGSTLLRAAKPVFIGLIVGEASAAGVLLVVSLILNALGYEYHPVVLLPG